MAAAGIQFLTYPVFGESAPSNKISLAGVGIGGMGKANLNNCSDENIVALCDVDPVFSREVRATYPQARFYTDYREMLSAEKELDGVVIATPDHTHALITLAAMEKGLHVYTQKPLTHSLHESRVLTKAAAKAPHIQTQMGNQGRSSETIRLLKEWLDAGAIGNVTEVHAWTDRPVGGQPWSTFPLTGRPQETPPVPENLDWDLWLGPAPYRPYHPIYHPLTWRGFYDFGTGPLGDMGCHILDPSFYALELGAPSAVEATSTHWEEGVSEETYPRATRVRYHFPARGNKPAVTLNWSDGRLLPFRPKGVSNEVKLPNSGALLIGDEGVIMHGSHGAGGLQIIPEAKMNAFLAKRPPKTIPRVKGSHEGDWIRACKDGQPASSNFSYGGPLTEMVLLGVLAIRVPNQRLEWDSRAMRFTNHEAANALVNPPYREGWKLPS
ncbi:MAG: Gfo/Idh/MocA family oxidoreductase [Verrucomicrobiae bacterium]|nr:Gfo/Idh/MocA family oxidoreductase [Verrucomicrobiae bacterium]